MSAQVNAALNAVSALCLLCGYLAIRRRRPRVHARFMVAALAASALFLVSYVVYHYRVGATSYGREDWTRPVYFAVLWSHVVLAVVNLPMVVVTAVRAFRRDLERHKRIARWTLPVWLYVSVTGVIVYLMLYR